MAVVVTGFVDVFAEVEPKVVRLKGKKGEQISSKIIIKPKEKYPFEIVNVSFTNGQFVEYSLEKLKDQNAEWVLTVKNKKDAGRFYDTLIVTTMSNKVERQIKIRIFGLIPD